MIRRPPRSIFFFNDTATTEIYTLSLHDALPISHVDPGTHVVVRDGQAIGLEVDGVRSEEHTSELQSQSNLVCRLLLEKKKKRMSSSICNHIIRSSVYTERPSLDSTISASCITAH